MNLPWDPTEEKGNGSLFLLPPPSLFFSLDGGGTQLGRRREGGREGCSLKPGEGRGRKMHHYSLVFPSKPTHKIGRIKMRLRERGEEKGGVGVGKRKWTNFPFIPGD